MIEHETRESIERRDAARLLLAEPLVHAHGARAAMFRLIRHHRDWLIDTFAQTLGYRLVIEATFARLYKTGLGDGSRPALRQPSGLPFSTRSYSYLALAVSALLTSREQLLLSQLVAGIRTAAADAAVPLDDSVADRRALAIALQQLVVWGVLIEDEGQVERLAEDKGAEALLTVNRAVVRHLVTGPLRRATSPAELIREAADPGPGGSRHAVRRRLVETPVVYLDDLNEEECAWLRQYQRREATQLAQQFGLELEVRAEGVAAFDRHESLTDREFPSTGTVNQAALLALSALIAAIGPKEVPNPRERLIVGVAIPDGLLHTILADLVAKHSKHWARDYVADVDLLEEAVLQTLEAVGLVARARTNTVTTRIGAGAWVLLSAAARYAPDAVMTAAPPSQMGLYGRD